MYKLLSKSIDFTLLSMKNIMKKSQFMQFTRFESVSKDYIPLTFPALSPTMHVGKIHKWKVKEGDKLEMGMTICEVETDKAIIDFDSSNEEYIAKILADEKSGEIPVGKTIALLTERKEDVTKIKNMKYEDNNKDKETTIITSSSSNNKKEKEEQEENNKNKNDCKEKLTNILISPSAKAMIYSEGNNIIIEEIKGSGKRGMIMKEDIINHLINKQTSKENTRIIRKINYKENKNEKNRNEEDNDEIKVITPSNMRRIIAERLTESKKQSPHGYTLIEIEV